MPIQDAPDGTLWTQIVDVVVDIPVPGAPAHETAVTKLARLATSSTSYGTVVSWTVTAAKIGVLRFVEMESDNYSKTRFQLTITGIVQFTDIQIESSLTLEWPDVKLAAAAVVLLEAKSSDGTAINVDGDILGKEVG
uniref:Uncharacterized protein n=1 Tax=viral metagenome TaxID=1070528 RepID=A0A6H1ZSF3_9ZZZZ